MMTQEEHLAWAKRRAMQYLPQDPNEALASFFSDMRKHPELVNHAGVELGAMLMFAGHLQTASEVQKHIEGCN